MSPSSPGTDQSLSYLIALGNPNSQPSVKAGSAGLHEEGFHADTTNTVVIFK